MAKTKLIDEIIAQVKATGRAKFDFGIFYPAERKGRVIKLARGGEKEIEGYTALFFRASTTLKRKIKDL